MDKVWKDMVESNIYDYIKMVDFKHPDFSVNELKNQLEKIIGVKPAVKLKWQTTEKINELLLASGVKDHKEVVESVQQVDIAFVDSDNSPIQLKLII